MKKIEVFCDGSGNTFDSDGGWAYRIVVDGQVFAEGSGYLSSATNNVAELTAAIRGLEQLKRSLHTIPCDVSKGDEIILTSDSQLVLGYASGKYQCKALHLTQLYIQLRQLYQELNLKTQWVKGHSGNEHNERCDVLAKAARESKQP